MGLLSSLFSNFGALVLTVICNFYYEGGIHHTLCGKQMSHGAGLSTMIHTCIVYDGVSPSTPGIAMLF